MTAPRSFLFVPGDSEKKLAKGLQSGADALVLDLEDSVAASQKAAARQIVAEALGGHRDAPTPQLWVRINPLATPAALEDLAAVIAARPDGLLLPKPDSAADLVRLDHYVSALEVAAGLKRGAIPVLPIATETPAAVFGLGTYNATTPRLAGLTWGAEDLPAAIGAAVSRWPDGQYTDLCRLVRSLCLAAAATSGVAAVETVYPAFRDLDGLRRYAARGRAEGFTAMMAIHPDQVPVIHEVFTSSADEMSYARRVVEAFAAQPDVGTLALDGRMLDLPHLKLAERLLGLGRA